MSSSEEWTDWHLTPSGWQMGSQKLDNGTVNESPPPPDRVQTVREYQSVSRWHSQTSSGITWETQDKEALERLCKKHGTFEEDQKARSLRFVEYLNTLGQRPRR